MDKDENEGCEKDCEELPVLFHTVKHIKDRQQKVVENKEDGSITLTDNCIFCSQGMLFERVTVSTVRRTTATTIKELLEMKKEKAYRTQKEDK